VAVVVAGRTAFLGSIKTYLDDLKFSIIVTPLSLQDKVSSKSKNPVE